MTEMTDIEMQQRFDVLLSKGLSAREAILQVKLESVNKDYQQFWESGNYAEGEETPAQELRALYDQIIEYGYSKEEAERLVVLKAENRDQVQTAKKAVRVGKYIAISELPRWKDITEKQREEMLWLLGFNTKNYKYVIDVLCQRVNNKVVCGEYIYSAERTDKQWLTSTINGVNLASEEARYHNCMDVLSVLRGNRRE